MNHSPPPNMISVLSSTPGVLGFLLGSARGFRAFDRDGKPIGYFPDKEQAVEAVYDAQDPMEGLYVEREYYGPQMTQKCPPVSQIEGGGRGVQ